MRCTSFSTRLRSSSLASFLAASMASLRACRTDTLACSPPTLATWGRGGEGAGQAVRCLGSGSSEGRQCGVLAARHQGIGPQAARWQPGAPSSWLQWSQWLACRQGGDGMHDQPRRTSLKGLEPCATFSMQQHSVPGQPLLPSSTVSQRTAGWAPAPPGPPPGGSASAGTLPPP